MSGIARNPNGGFEKECRLASFKAAAQESCDGMRQPTAFALCANGCPGYLPFAG
jgi:hypothetical protein